MSGAAVSSNPGRGRRLLISTGLFLLAVAAGWWLSGELFPRAAEARRLVLPTQGYFEVEMPTYPGAVEFPLGREITLNRAPMQIS